MRNLSWPGGKPFALCLTHDVDRFRKQWYHYFWNLAFGKSSIKKQARSLVEKLSGHDPYENFQWITKLEAALGVRSTFLFMDERIRKLHPNFMGRYKLHDPRIIKWIGDLDANRWEIGLHGSYESYRSRTLLGKEKDGLEAILGHEVVSTRQHHLLMDCQTFKIHASLGFKYDSTIGYSDKLNGELFPYRLPEGALELPLTAMDTMRLERDEVINSIWEQFERTAREGGLMTLNFHQCRLNPIENPHLCRLYEHLLRRAKEMDAFIAPMEVIGRHIEQWERENCKI